MSQRKLKALDLFCGAGGVSWGLHQAGLEVTGVDINPQKRYPFQERFHQADALEFVRQHGHEYDLIWASPPCQCYSTASGPARAAGKIYPDLIAVTREALFATGKPYIIENVSGAKKHLRNYITLCGLSFGLKVFRHRLFECSHFIPEPAHQPHKGRYIGKDGMLCVVGNQGSQKGRGGKEVKNGTVAQARAAMGIDWMIWRELTQAIPPAYSQYLGEQIIRYL